VTDAITTIKEWLPPRGMTSIPENPIKPAQANALHHALADLAALVEAAERINLSEEDAERASVQEHLDAIAAFRTALARVKGEQNG
jgi:hypothetical protein